MDDSRTTTLIDLAVILIDIGQRYRSDISALELYEATRGAWHVGNRRHGARYVFSVSDTIVREVYEIGSWHRAGTTPYRIRPFVSFSVEGRWEFLGQWAAPEIRARFKHTCVAEYFLHPHAVIYVNC